MDRVIFYRGLRKRDSGVFGNRLSQPQVEGCEAILDAGEWYGLADERHCANVLGQVYHETGGYMSPIKETVFAAHTDKTPSDTKVVKRLQGAWERGQLPWVTTPYWRDGWFGRGQIQLTHRSNYARMGRRLGVDLVADPSRALDPTISARIAVVGMAEGMFCAGHDLARYFDDSTDDPRGARRIVNGPDGTDSKVAGYHRAFLAALRAAGWSGRSTDPDPPEPTPSERRRDADEFLAYIARLIAEYQRGG